MLGLGMMRLGAGSGGSAISTIFFWLRNVLSLLATVGPDATFSRGGSKVYVPTWDATVGLLVTEIPADGIASPGMRYDSGAWYSDDGAGNSLHPTNAAGVYLVYPAWADVTIYAANSYSVDFVGNQAKYYKTTLGGTSSGTGVADDTGVTDWVLQGNYSNAGGGTLPGLLDEPAEVNLVYPTTGWSAPWVYEQATSTGDKLEEDGSTSVHDIYQALGVVDTSLDRTIYARITPGGERANGRLTLGNGGLIHGCYIDFNVDTLATTTGVFGLGVVTDSGIYKQGADVIAWVSGKANAGSVILYSVYSLRANVGAISYPGTPGFGMVIPFKQVTLGACHTSEIPTTTGTVQRNASVETNPHIFTARFLRYRVTDTNTETHLTDVTNTFAYDSATTTLTFTDGVTTLTTITALVIGDTIVLDQTDGKLYINGVLKDTDVLLAPTWAAITGIGNITDLTEGTTIDPTDTTWDKV